MMGSHNVRRRDMLAGGAGLAVSLVTGARADIYPFSSGEEKPRTVAPAGATDCHLHMFDERYPVQVGPSISKFEGNATAADYLKVRARLGLSRNILVQPSTYGTDNSLLLASLVQFGGTARGVAVIDPDVPDKTLSDFSAKGIRGIRINLVQAGATTVEMVDQLAQKVAPLGWHCSFNISPRLIVENAALLQRLPTTIVLEHTARLSSIPLDHPAVTVVRGLLDKGNTWIKLTSAIRQGGDQQQVDKFIATARALYSVPDRMVWGSDWPHVGSSGPTIPDDAFNFDLLEAAIGGGENLHRVLTVNPGRLYGFPPLNHS